MVTPLEPNVSEAKRFLDILEPDGEFWFQTAMEPKKSKGKNPARVLHGKFVDVAKKLALLNQTGHAIWVQINAGTGRGNADITRIRAYFIDQDNGASDLLFTSPLPADIIVESSPGKFHGYWLTGDAPLDDYAARMHSLADKFHGDHNVCHLGRVMRLPGFYHLKYGQHMSRIAKVREGL